MFELLVFAKLDDVTNTLNGAALPTPSVCGAFAQNRPM